MKRQDASTGEIIDSEPSAPVQAKEKRDTTGKLLMYVKVYSPFVAYFDGDAYSITGENATGPFDILPKHHNFLTLLSPCELVIRSPQGDRKIRIARGIMHVKADKAVVFLDV